MKTIKKILTGFITACMVLSASSITAFAAEADTANNSIGNSIVQYAMNSGWAASIPAFITPSVQDEVDTAQYNVDISDIVLGNSEKLVTTIEYDGRLVEANGIEIPYTLYDANGEISTGDEIISTDSGNPNAVASYSFGAALNQNAKYAGTYTGTATFNFTAEEKIYTAEEIENDAHLFGIGATKPEYVISKFNDDFTEVTIFSNGKDSDGEMMSFQYRQSPMRAYNSTLKKAIIESKVHSVSNNSFYGCASFIQDDIVTDLCNINRPCCLSIDLVAIPTDEAVSAAQNIKMRVEGNKLKYLRKAANKGMYGATITYDMQQQLEEADEFLNDLTERDQRMFVANVSMVHLADSLQDLQSDTEEILASARKGMCNMGTLMFQQLQGLTTALPYGVNRLNAERTLTTESASIFMPFRAQEVTDKGGLFAGVNAVTGNLLLTDLQLLNNPNRFVIGIPGSGKSFGVKMNIFQIFLNTNHDIIILDPECEYAPLVKAIGGQVITLSASSDTHINPFDMVAGYAEHSSLAYYEKSNFIVSLFEQIDKSEPLGGNDKSIIDRCVINIYKKCENTPTLDDLRKELEDQPEPRAKELALKLELFTTGSLNVFSNQTNVEFKNRIICFDTSKLEGDLKTIGNLIVSDCLVNRVTSNFKVGKLTDLFFDEFQTFLKDKYSAEYFNSAWRRYRKRGASPCGITQNIEYLKSDVEFSTMLGNSTCVTLYQLTADDIKIVSDMYNLSEEQLKFVSETTLPGNGLMRIGGSIVPFDGQWPKNNALYKLMTTKPDEWCA